ncbi:MAG: DEAD/DEAH box helicase [Archaeoglobaceae archaeon]|nr:DEAD/DEAH box helicase [Archaeoglobaceae archaeon]MCX8152458.1 DEAD/DEAH box helicase [Archaeoglobaceae archaeon]MDW8013798.1 DEAD/DEAH box helicase [Archaeoglobaceae archaeon]
MFVTHPLIKEQTLERRAYQIAIATTALLKNTLVVIPTGLGKTAIAALVIASRLLNEEGQVLFLAPTKPLVEQHSFFLRKTIKIDQDEIVALSGEIPPEARSKFFGKKIIVSTPQVIENDLVSGRINLENFVLVVFDEAHRAVGNYSYVYIAKEYLKQARKPLILALTASPGSDVERIWEIITNLGIQALEVRSEWDDDVKPYVAEKDIEWIRVELPKELEIVKNKIEESLKFRFDKLKKFGIDAEELSKKELLALQEALQVKVAEGKEELFEAISILAEILKLLHAVELIETQGVEALKSYLKRLLVEASGRGSRASKNIANDPIFREAVFAALKCKEEHPKLNKLKEVVKKQLEENKDSRIIVFTNFRDTAEKLVKELSNIASTSKFVGQAEKDYSEGMSQKEQIEILEKFRNGEVSVLVATSIGEEGLDIPATDLVVFYEAVPSEIRAIQRKGRTGRGREGKIVVLVTKGTRDEAYYYASIRREKIMYERLLEVKRKLEKGQIYFPELGQKIGVKIIVDSRELRSEVPKILKDRVDLEVKTLEVGDYVLSDRVAVERKTVEDFVESIIEAEKLFSQVAKLRAAYQKPVLIIEGQNIYSRLHPNAVRGAIASIAIDFGVPVIFTSNPNETAEFLIAIARREQEERKRSVVEHVDKTKRTLKDEMEYVVSAISNVGSVVAKNLLEHFQTIEKIATASVEELIEVPKVGKKTAERIRTLMTTPYSDADKVQLE